MSRAPDSLIDIHACDFGPFWSGKSLSSLLCSFGVFLGPFAVFGSMGVRASSSTYSRKLKRLNFESTLVNSIAQEGSVGEGQYSVLHVCLRLD